MSPVHSVSRDEYRRTSHEVPVHGSPGNFRMDRTLLELLNPTMEYRLTVLVDRFSQLFEGEDLNGVWRFRFEGEPHRERLDCSFVGESDRDSDRLFRHGDGGVFEEGDFSVDVYTDSGRLYLASVLYNSYPHFQFKWGNWWAPASKDCGDGWIYRSFPDAEVFAVCDGLGTGSKAAQVSRRVRRIIDETGDASVVKLVETIHDDLGSSRGAVGFVGRISRGANRLDYCSVGNISARILGLDRDKSLFSFNGTLGYVLPEIQAYSESLENATKIILHTDGVEPPGPDFYDEAFRESTPSMGALRLFELHRRSDDDALVSVIDCRDGFKSKSD